MSQSASVVAQAKINLLLRVLARETTGYHSIETIFLRLELGDDVRVRIANRRSLDCTGPAMPPHGLGPIERNLAYRAAVAYADTTGWPSGFAIEVMKRIPAGGGLGGGSADAGAVLRALDALAPNPLGTRLVELGTALGADVPFMSTEHPMALAWGRGERILPLRPLDPRPIALVVPGFPVGTADAYGWLSTDRGRYVPEAHVIAPESFATWESAAAAAANDFESVVARRHPVLTEYVEALESAGAALAMMSGSGSTVFGVFDDAPTRGALSNFGTVPVTLTRTAASVARVRVD
ncbi:MAG TPA: 4-(cytidine 5'-diphospho)-2-C-methyl-D-erythritol kinase [Gemmatimonadaceae bacterium]|jgi:4-diphosphocytidyl-2-C-methyl-D-erythritol kinase